MKSVNTTTSKIGVHRIKICGYCGKAEGRHYAKHNTEKHPGQDPLIWNPNCDLLDDPWCSNWKEMIENPKVKVLEKLSNFKRGVGSLKGIASRS